MPFPAIEQARLRRSEYGRPPRDTESCAAWVERYYNIPVYLDQRLPRGVHGVLDITPILGAAICISRRSPWPRWSICHELGHRDTGCVLPPAPCVFHWRYAAHERIANRYATELAAPAYDVIMLLQKGLTIRQTARALDVPLWVIEARAAALHPERGDEWLFTA